MADREASRYLKRFGKIGGGKVITRISLRPLTVGDNPKGVQLIPNFAKPPGRCVQAVERTADRVAETVKTRM